MRTLGIVAVCVASALVGAGASRWVERADDGEALAHPLLFDFEEGSASAKATDPLVLEAACDEIEEHFTENPIPVGAIDVSTGREILGYEVTCGSRPVASAGSMSGPGPERTIPRLFGHLRIKYAP